MLLSIRHIDIINIIIQLRGRGLAPHLVCKTSAWVDKNSWWVRFPLPFSKKLIFYEKIVRYNYRILGTAGHIDHTKVHWFFHL